MNNLVLFRMLENQMVKNYHLKNLLGVGGFGGVYEATQLVQDQPMPRSLAVKLIPNQPNKNDSQLRELMSAMELDYRYIIRCHDAGDWHCDLLECDFLYLVMEQATTSVQKQLEQQGKFSETKTRLLIQQVASALIYLHGQNKVHRDLKPGNVLLVKDTWKVSDLGLIRHLPDTFDYLRTDPTGTLPYMPPEAFEGDRGIVSPAWDSWSLGIMIVEALTGERPYQSDDSRQLVKQVVNCELRIPALPDKFASIVQGCLQKNRRDRWTARQVHDALTKENRFPEPGNSFALTNGSRRERTGSGSRFTPEPKDLDCSLSSSPQSSREFTRTRLEIIALVIASGVLVACLIIFIVIKQKKDSPFDTVSNFYESVSKNPNTALNLSSANYQNLFNAERKFWDSVKDSKIKKSTVLGQSNNRNSFQVTVEYFMQDGTVICEQRIIELLFDTKEQKWLIDKNIRLTDSTGC